MLYDDEGYVLLTLRNVAEHGGLYDKVYSQYGPFFYALLGGIAQLFGFEWTNVSGRWLTLINWIGISFIGGLLVWRTSRCWPAALIAQISVFGLLWVMLNEPAHPGGLIALLVAGAAWLGVESIHQDRPYLLAIGVGTLGACVALTKINVGAFLVCAAGLWIVIGLPGRFRKPATATMLVFVTVLPFGLMQPLMDRPWVPTLALLTTLAGLSVILVASQDHDRRTQPRHLILFIVAGVATTLLVALWCFLHGTTPVGLWHGIVLEPLRHPGIYAFPVRWRPLVLPVAGLGLGLSCAWALRPRWEIVLRIIAGGRLLIAVGFAVALLPWISTSQAALALCYGVPLAGLFAIPLRPAIASREARIRTWLALLLVFQSLQVFPIAGSQLNWGTFLWIPLLVLGVIDAIAFWQTRASMERIQVLPISFAILACGMALLQGGHLARITHARMADSLQLGLPGAETVMMPPPVSSALNVITTNARVHADVLFSLPGAFSFNQWTGRPTPTLQNVTHWFSLLPENEQRAIIKRLEDSPNSMFVLQRHLLVHTNEQGFKTQGPLVAYLHSQYEPFLAIDIYSLWARKGRRIVRLETGQLGENAEGPVILANLPPLSKDVARIEILDLAASLPAPISFALANLAPRAAALSPEGELLEALTPVGGVLPPGGIRKLEVSAAGIVLPPPDHLLVLLFSSNGERVGVIRFLPSGNAAGRPAPGDQQQTYPEGESHPPKRGPHE